MCIHSAERGRGWDPSSQHELMEKFEIWNTTRMITELGEPTKIVGNKYYSEGRCDHPVPREIYRGHPQGGNGTSKPPMDPSEVEAEFRWKWTTRSWRHYHKSTIFANLMRQRSDKSRLSEFDSKVSTVITFQEIGELGRRSRKLSRWYLQLEPLSHLYWLRRCLGILWSSAVDTLASLLWFVMLQSFLARRLRWSEVMNQWTTRKYVEERSDLNGSMQMDVQVLPSCPRAFQYHLRDCVWI